MVSKANRSQPKRAAILDEAVRLFRSKGYGSTSMKDIARACGFQAGNIYNYFTTKEEILYEVLLSEMERSLSVIGAFEFDEATSPTERLRSFIHNVVDIAVGRKRSVRVLGDVGLLDLTPTHRKKMIELRDAWEKVIRTIIRAGIAAGEFDEVDEKMASFAIIAMVLRTQVWFSPRGRYSSDEVADFIFHLAMNGLKASKSEEAQAGRQTLDVLSPQNRDTRIRLPRKDR